MSIISTVYLPDGIVMAGDSRLTGNRTENNVRYDYTLTDNAQKVFLLSKIPIGIAACGNAMPDGKTVSDYIRLFEINSVTENDNIETVANKLAVESKDTGAEFFVCGYLNDIPHVYTAAYGNVERTNYAGDSIIYGASWKGMIESICKLFCDEPVTEFDWHLMPLQDGIDLAEYIVNTTIGYERFKRGIQTCGGCVDVLVINKDTAFWHKHKFLK